MQPERFSVANVVSFCFEESDRGLTDLWEYVRFSRYRRHLMDAIDRQQGVGSGISIAARMLLAGTHLQWHSGKFFWRESHLCFECRNERRHAFVPACYRHICNAFSLRQKRQ